MSERINTPFTNEHFVAFCEKMVGLPYWYGTVVYKCTENLCARKAKQYPAHYGSNRTARYRDDIAKKKVCADCVGLIKGYQWTNGGQGVIESIGTDKTFGKVLKTVGVALGAVAVAAGAAAVKLGKEVITAYADYEQLVGGVDTLFKDSSQEIQRYAANAYKTAGLSANEYMETVTGFSASLIQSLGGDTEKAAKYADMAITDMSDNANKMGTDMSSIQNAYQGFNRRRAQRQNGRGERSRHALAQLFHGGADGRALFPEGRQRIACLRPCGLHPGKAFGGRANLLLGLPKRALRVVQIGAGLRDRVRVVLEAFRIGRQLALQLFDLGGGLRILLRKRV